MTRGDIHPSTMSEAPAALTIISRNYLSHARILAKSYLANEPRGRFYLFVVDGLPKGVGAGPDVQMITPKELALPYFYELCFKYDVTELSTAVKPSLLAHLIRQRGETHVIYLDPDILIMRPMDELKRMLNDSSIVLVPHLLEPIPLDGRKPSEQDILIAGAYNLGIVALHDSDEAREFLDWWEARLRDACRVDPAQGLMVDQRWIDLVPALFPSTRILRDETYDVAYWNLHSRKLKNLHGRVLVNGQPLTFFHFSGFNPLTPMLLSKHQNRIRVRRGSAVAKLLHRYAELQMKHGYARCSQWDYGYSHFGNGIRVHPLLRELYLKMDDESRGRFDDPFCATSKNSFLKWATEPRGSSPSPFLDLLYRQRYDIADAFPDPRRKDRAEFLQWARTVGAREMGYDPRLVHDRALTRAASAAHTGPKLISSQGVNVCGYLRNESGLGAAARGYVQALRASKVPFALKDVSKLSVNRSKDRTLTEFHREHPYDINLVCVNADQHFTFMADAGVEFFRDHYNIGAWFWELPRFPEDWHDRFDYYNELWVGSSFIANALAPVSPIPVVCLPPALAREVRGSALRGRRRLRVAPDEFVFLFIFDFHSYFERKNPLAVISAFKQAFARSDRARLVIKCVNARECPDQFEKMRRGAEGYPISIYDGYWPSHAIQDLMSACDAYVSLHRSEGMGLTIVDAMAHSKPVIATAWSGNMDVMNVGNSFPVRYELIELAEKVGPYRAGEVWANPSIDHAAECMRLVFEERGEAQVRGERARRELIENASAEKIAERVEQRLTLIHTYRRSPPRLLPAGANETVEKRAEYRKLVARVRESARASLPEDARAIVVSKGDEQLLRFKGRLATHFPQSPDGAYAGFYPSDSAQAIAHLESLRQRGASHFILPSTAFWWLDHYADFRRHLDARYRRILNSEDCIIFHLARNGQTV